MQLTMMSTPCRSVRLARGCVLIALLLFCPGRARAQGAPWPLVWERVGTIEKVYGMLFDGDTLYAAALYPFKVLQPGDTDWSDAFPANAFAQDLFITPDRVIFALRPNGLGLLRSADGGSTWMNVVNEALRLPVLTPEGALFTPTRGNADGQGAVGARSIDGGATWTYGGLGQPGEGVGSLSVLVMPTSVALPNGRLVAAGYNGIAYSDDDGRTFRPSAIYRVLDHVSDTAVRIEGGPYDGRLLAVVQGSLGIGVFASADGIGWTLLSPVPTGTTFTARLVATPDGAVYAYDRRATVERTGYPMYRSTDGGATWTDVGPVGDGLSQYPPEVREVVVGPDGRLYAATSLEGRYDPGREGGVFRTVAPVVVAAEAPPAEAPGVGLSVRPNPTGGRAAVVLRLAEEGAVRVSVVDALGREVAVLLDGPARAGEQRLEVDTASWPPGIYIVRATAEKQSASARLVVAR